MDELFEILTAAGIECDDGSHHGAITVIHAGAPALVISYGFLTGDWHVRVLDAGVAAIVDYGRDLWVPLDRLAGRSEAARVVLTALDRAVVEEEWRGIERIREALLDAGWCPQLYDRGYTCETESGRIVLHVYADNEGRWVAVMGGRQSKFGPDPLTALRRAYAAEDSRRVRAALRPVLVELREPEVDRYDEVIAQIGALPDSPWLGHVRDGASDLLPHLPDAADRYLLALDLAGDPPEEIRDTVAALRARLEEMG